MSRGDAEHRRENVEVDETRSSKPCQLALALDQPSLPQDVSADAGVPTGVSADELAGALARILDTRLTLSVHDNRSTMVSFRREAGRIDLRVHRMFLQADAHTRGALAEYARSGSKGAGRALDQFVERHQSAIRAQDPSHGRVLDSKGTVYDLQRLFDELNEAYFAGAVTALIGWGRERAPSGRRSIRLGAYFEKTRTILIHPSLDAPHVPQVFVAFIVYHEMLHQAVPAQRSVTGRRNVHPPEFRRRERLFSQYAEARRFERRHVSMLLSPPEQPSHRTVENGY